MAFIWIGGTLLTSQRTSGISPEIQKAAQPLNPNIDMQTLTELESKRVFAPEELRGFPIFMLDRSGDGENQDIVTIDSIEEEAITPPVFDPVQQTEELESSQPEAEQEQNDPTQTQNEASNDTQEFVPQPLDFVSDGPPTQ